MDLATVVTSVSGPKRPHDRVAVSEMQADFRACLKNKVRRKKMMSCYKIDRRVRVYSSVRRICIVAKLLLCDKLSPVMDILFIYFRHQLNLVYRIIFFFVVRRHFFFYLTRTHFSFWYFLSDDSAMILR